MPVPIVTEGWPLEAFVGDVLVCTLRGRYLDQVKAIKVAPAAKGITATIGDLKGQKPQSLDTAESLTITIEIDPQTYPGEKRIVLVSEDGESDPVPFLVMM